MLGALITKDFLDSSPCLSIDRLDVDVIEKNNEVLYCLARRRLSRSKTGETIFGPMVRAEILQSMENDRLLKELNGA